MVVCRKCGYRNSPDDAFCGSCGGFLEWTGERVKPSISDEVVQEAETTAAREQRRGGVISRIMAKVLSPGEVTDPDTSRQVSLGAAAAPPKPPSPPDPPPRRQQRPTGTPALLPTTPTQPPPAPETPTEPLPEPSAPQPPATEKPPEPEPRTPATLAPGEPPRAPAPVPAGSDGAQLIAPIAESEPRPGTAPEEVKPQVPHQRLAAIRKTAPSRRLRPGDLICGTCGEGNLPTRRFCGRCGDGLATAEVVPQPWWRRLLWWRGRRVIPAGARPSGERVRRGGRWKATVLKVYRVAWKSLAAGLAALTALYLFFPPARDLLSPLVTANWRQGQQKVMDWLRPSYVPVRPVEVTSNSEHDGHGALLATDQYSNTFWIAHWDPDRQPALVLRFDPPTTLQRLILHSGAAEGFTEHARPAELHLVYSTGASDTVKPQDKSGAQTLELHNAVGVSVVEIRITAVYQAQDATTVALSEIELFRRK